MADFITLQSRVLSRLIDAPPSVQSDVPVYINQAIREIEDSYNFSIMRSNVQFTTVENIRTLGTMPENYKEFRSRCHWDDSAGGRNWLAPTATSVQEAIKDYTATDVGPPRLLATADFAAGADGLTNTLLLLPLPDHNGPDSGDYTINVPYWRYLNDLAADSDTNWFATYGELYLLYQATGHGFMADWNETRAGAEFQLAAGYRKRLIRRAANQSIQPMDNLAVRSDVNRSREAWRSS